MNQNRKISEQIRKAILVICAVVGGLWVLYFLVIIVFMLGTPYFETVYSNNFSNQKFNSIKTGISTEEVRKVLGEPLAIRDIEGEEVWYYTEGKDLHNSSYFVRVIKFKDKKVIEIIRDTYYD